MKSQKVVLTAVALIGAIALAIPAQGEPESGHTKGGEKWREKEHHSFPRPTEEQLEKLQSIRDDARVASASKEAEIMALRHKMMNILAQPTIDKEAATGLHNKIVAIKAELEEIKFKTLLESADVLTAEQRQMIHKKMLRMHGFWGGHHAGGWQHGPMRHHQGPMRHHTGFSGGPEGPMSEGGPPMDMPPGFPGMGPGFGPPPLLAGPPFPLPDEIIEISPQRVSIETQTGPNIQFRTAPEDSERE